MNKYETVIKALSQIDRETLERLAEGFLKSYDYGYFLKYEDSKEILHNFIKYFPHTDVRVIKATVNDSTFLIFGDIIKTSYLKKKQYCLIRWNEDFDNFNKKSLSILDITECNCCCEVCEIYNCCYESIFFIEEFYNYCLKQDFIKALIQESKSSDEEVKTFNKEEKEENMDNLRIIAENLVNNISKYEEIIDNLIDIGVKDEKIYNIFYEILKNINE